MSLLSKIKVGNGKGNLWQTPHLEIKPQPLYDIDWDKVVTLEDIKIVLKTVSIPFRGLPNETFPEDIRHFLKIVEE